jgi:hypothetical protein
LAEAEQSGISQLDAAGFAIILSAYVCIWCVSYVFSIRLKNQKLRVKYPNDSDKFMASEVELHEHEEIQELHTIAVSPELYYILVDTKVVISFLDTLDILLLLTVTTLHVYLRSYHLPSIILRKTFSKRFM